MKSPVFNPDQIQHIVTDPSERQKAVNEVLGRTDLVVPPHEQTLMHAYAAAETPPEDLYARGVLEVVAQKYINRFDWLSAWGVDRPTGSDAQELDEMIALGSLDANVYRKLGTNIVDSRVKLLQTVGLPPKTINQWRRNTTTLRPSSGVIGMTRVVSEFDGDPKGYFSNYGAHFGADPLKVKGYLQTIAGRGVKVGGIVNTSAAFLPVIAQRIDETLSLLDTIGIKGDHGNIPRILPVPPDMLRERIITLSTYGIGLGSMRTASKLLSYRSAVLDEKFKQAAQAERSLGLEEGTIRDELCSHPVTLEMGVEKATALVKIFRLAGDQTEFDTFMEQHTGQKTGSFIEKLQKMPIERIMDFAEAKIGDSSASLVEAIAKNSAKVRADKNKPTTFAASVERWPIIGKSPTGRAAIDAYLETL